MTAPAGTMFKPTKAASKAARQRVKKDRRNAENREMRKARKRDGGCRFPLCGCRAKGIRPEVSHLRHRGSGGDPSGERTQSPVLITLCHIRHQIGRVSRHAHSLRADPRTDLGYNGAVRWWVLLDVVRDLAPHFIDIPAAYLDPDGDGHWWVLVAVERTPSLLSREGWPLFPLHPWQRVILEGLGRMER